MVARAMYRASLRIGRERVGVKLYSAAVDKDVHFHLLHESDGVRVRQRMVDPASGETVATEDVVRGVEVDRGVFVTVASEELDALKPASTRDIEVDHFVEADALDHRLYERPYLLGPENGNVQRYFAVARALESTGRQGIARWTMRNREYRGALRLEGQHLALIALRSIGELLPVEQLHVESGRDLDARELALAKQLVDALAGPFDPADYRDEYRERVLAYIEDKQRGKHVKLRRFKPRKVQDDALVAALEQSLRRAG
jgi:DNA end-binding protein Ku